MQNCWTAWCSVAEKTPSGTSYVKKKTHQTWLIYVVYYFCMVMEYHCYAELVISHIKCDEDVTHHHVENKITDAGKYDKWQTVVEYLLKCKHTIFIMGSGFIWFMGFFSLKKGEEGSMCLKSFAMNNSTCQSRHQESCMTEGWIHTWCPCSRSVCTVRHHKLTCLSHKFVSIIWLTSSWKHSRSKGKQLNSTY